MEAQPTKEPVEVLSEMLITLSSKFRLVEVGKKPSGGKPVKPSKNAKSVKNDKPKSAKTSDTANLDFVIKAHVDGTFVPIKIHSIKDSKEAKGAYETLLDVLKEFENKRECLSSVGKNSNQSRGIVAPKAEIIRGSNGNTEIMEQLQTHKTKIEELEMERDGFKSTIKELENKRNTLTREKEDEKKTLQNKIRELEKQITGLESKNKSHEREQYTNSQSPDMQFKEDSTRNMKELTEKNAEIESKFHNLERDVAQKQLEIVKLKEDLSTSEKNWDAEKSRLLRENSGMKKKFGQKQQSNDSRDQLHADIQMLKNEIEEKKSEIKKLEENLEVKESENARLQKLLDNTKDKTKQSEEKSTSNKEQLSQEVRRLETELKNKQSDIAKLKSELRAKKNEKDTKDRLIEQLMDKMGSSKDEIVNNLIQKNAENIDRLAAEMNAKIAADESDLENISIKCRPMNVAEEYNLLCSNSWLDAKTALDENGIREEEGVKFLCQVLLDTQSEASTELINRQNCVATALKNPKKLMTEGKNSLELGQNLPQAILTQMGDYLRTSVNEEDGNTIAKMVTDKYMKNGDKKRYVKQEKVTDYIKEAACLGWKMAIQRPPMSFVTPGVNQPYKENESVDLFWGSKPVPGAKIKYFVNPILMHGDKTMTKGKVFVG